MVKILMFIMLSFLTCRPVVHNNKDDTLIQDSAVVDSGYLDLIMYIEDAPIYNGDIKAFIQTELNYPLSAKKDSIEGTVYISFMIDTLGSTNNHKVVRGIRDDLNEEAIRVTKKIKFDKPAFQRGKPITVPFMVPVVFDLQQECSNN